MKRRTKLKRWMRRLSQRRFRKVTCLDCGFLTMGGREVVEADRVLLNVRNAGMPGGLEELGCARGLWVEYDLTYASVDSGNLLDEAAKQRRCRGYFKYRPGWSTEGHQALLLRKEDRFHHRITNLVFLVIGALLTLLVQWLSQRLGLS